MRTGGSPGTSAWSAAPSIRLLLYGVFGTHRGAVNLIIDYARIRIVVEDRRSALGAIVGSLGS